MSKKNKKNKNKNKSPQIEYKHVEEEDIYQEDTIEEVDSQSFWLNKKIHIALIFVLSFVIYTNTFSHEYAVDDSIVILRNEFTKKGLKGMPGIWKEDTFTGFFGKKRNLVAGGRYRPLSLATFALELELWGTPITNQDGSPRLDADGDINYIGNPSVSHIINVLLYSLLCVVIYLMLLQMFNPKEEQDNFKAYFIALAGAILYATHPIHTEAVANIKGRDEIMVLLGSVLATYWILKAAVAESNKEIIYVVGAILAFIFSIFSKENAVTFLAIIPAALYFFTSTKVEKIATYTAPFLIIVAIFWFGIRGSILGEAGKITGNENAPATELMNDPFLKIEGNQYVAYEDSERFATVLYTWYEYIRLLVYPSRLTNDYYPKHIRTDKDLIPNFGMPKVLLSLLIHMLMGALIIVGILKRKPYAFFLLFYLATFSVVSNLIFPIGSNMAERFMFLPSVGFSALCAMGLYELTKKMAEGKATIAEGLPVPLILLGITTLLYAGKSYSRNFAWKNDYTLFTTDIDNSPHSAKLNNAASGVIQEKSRFTTDDYERKNQLEKALGYSITATTLHPTYNNAWLLRGNANIMLGNLNEKMGGGASVTPQDRANYFQKSLEHFDKGVIAYKEVKRLRPDHPDVQQNLAVAYRDKGKLLGRRLQQTDASIQSLKESLKYKAKDFECFRLLGIAYGVKGMELQNKAAATNNQGLAQEAVQYHYKAIEYLEKAVALVPEDAPKNVQQKKVPLLYNLEVAHRMMNLPAKVEEYKAKRMAIDPNYDPRKQE